MNADAEEERAWIRRSQAGDAQAYAALVERYQRMIHALTYRMTGSLTEAEDLAQETFVRAWRQLEQFRGDAAFSSWLYRIALNLGLNWRKRRERRQRLHEEWAQDPTRGVGSGEAPADVSARVQSALMRLPDKQRAAILLTVYENRNHAEAARILGCSETTVSWRVFMARKKLRQWLLPGK